MAAEREACAKIADVTFGAAPRCGGSDVRVSVWEDGADYVRVTIRKRSDQ
jgi:hypothetical protein